MNELIEQHKNNLKHLITLVELSPFKEVSKRSSIEYTQPLVVEEQIIEVIDSIDKFKEIYNSFYADRSGNSREIKEYVKNSIYQMINSYTKWYDVNSEEIVEKLGPTNMYLATRNIMEIIKKEISIYLLNLKDDINQNFKVEKISLSIIALKYIYEGILITREDAEMIALKYGHTSGDALYNKYSKYSSKRNRIGKPHPFTRKKLENRIELIQSVINILPNNVSNDAVEELIILNAYLEEL